MHTKELHPKLKFHVIRGLGKAYNSPLMTQMLCTSTAGYMARLEHFGGFPVSSGLRKCHEWLEKLHVQLDV